jgi:hypothetical protein
MIKCRTCLHPDVVAIDAALLRGEKQRAVGRQFGLSHDSVRRHVDRDLMAPEPAPGQQVRPVEPEGGEPTALDEMRALVESLKATPTAGLSPTVRMMIAREKRLAVVELAKIAPPPPPNGGIDWSQSQEWAEFCCWWEQWMLTRDPTRALLNDWRAACHERLARGDLA